MVLRRSLLYIFSDSALEKDPAVKGPQPNVLASKIRIISERNLEALIGEQVTMSWIIKFVLLCGLLSLNACALDVFHDAISTELEVPLSISSEPFSVDKRFRFERSISEAKGAQIHRAWIEVDGGDIDLSALSLVRVFAVNPDTEERQLIIEGGDFRPGENFNSLEIIYTEDVRHWVKDQRFTVAWEITPNRFTLSDEDLQDQIMTIGFGIVLEIDTAN